MFRRRLSTVLTTAVVGAALLVPGAAGAQDGPEFVEQQTFFTCDGPTPVTNVNGGTPTWGTEEPTGGNESACGTAAGANGFEAAAWEGTFTGNLDTMDIELHQIAPQNALYGDISITVTLFVDGFGVASGTVADPRTVQSESGASWRVDLGFVDLGIIDDEDGPGDEEHTYRIEVEPSFVDSGAIIGWVWGARDIPAGITFNGDVRRGTEIN